MDCVKSPNPSSGTHSAVGRASSDSAAEFVHLAYEQQRVCAVYISIHSALSGNKYKEGIKIITYKIAASHIHHFFLSIFPSFLFFLGETFPGNTSVTAVPCVSLGDERRAFQLAGAEPFVTQGEVSDL